MSSNPAGQPGGRLPLSLAIESDEHCPGCFKLVDKTGRSWANAVPTRTAAGVLATAPRLLQGLDATLDYLLGGAAWTRWDIPSSGPALLELAEDDNGPLETEYPGAPELARWLLGLSKVLAAAGAGNGSWPIHNDDPEQLDLPWDGGFPTSTAP